MHLSSVPGGLLARPDIRARQGFAGTRRQATAGARPQNGLATKISELLRISPGLPATSTQIESALKELTAVPQKGGGTETLRLGQGTWEVFSAPHIARMSGALGTTFSPIRYTLRGDEITSNVRFSSTVFQEGWLSASGTLEASDPDTVQVKFDRFWVDFGGSELRKELTGTKSNAFVDPVGWIGRLFFLPQLSYFPVLYVDSEIAVFSFPPLSSNIAVQRVS